MNESRSKITLHAVRRMKSRLRLSGSKKQLKLLDEVLKNGIREEDLEDGVIKDFLASKGDDTIKIVYNNFVYIFGKNSRKLITLYELPCEYTGGKNDGQ